jgi:hypothetical protein
MDDSSFEWQATTSKADNAFFPQISKPIQQKVLFIVKKH